MTPQEKAQELVNKFYSRIDKERLLVNRYWSNAKFCALITVDYIITSNPHSNPFNTDVYSTINYWQEVKQEIEKL